MKLRLLKKLLGDTGYTLTNRRTAIFVGGAMCADIISLDIETLTLKCGVDPFNKGRKSLNNVSLEYIWDRLSDMIKTGEIKDIISGNDQIENPLPVYTVENGKLIKTFTDKYGWPGITVEGYEMHDNTYFKTPGKAIDYFINEYNCGARNCNDSVMMYMKQANDLLTESNKYTGYVADLVKLKAK